MPLSAIQTYELENPMTNYSEVMSITKRTLYTSAVATAASYFLGGESFGDSSTILGMSLPNPVVAGLSIGIGAAAGKAVNDLLVPKFFPMASDEIKTTEKLVVESGLTVAGGLAGMKYFAGVDPNVNNALIAGGSYIGGSWIQQNADNVLLGRLW